MITPQQKLNQKEKIKIFLIIAKSNKSLTFTT